MLIKMAKNTQHTQIHTNKTMSNKQKSQTKLGIIKVIYFDIFDLFKKVKERLLGM
jgi:hypothetical protein